MPSPRPRRRPRLLPALLAASVLLVACAEVDRTVTHRAFLPNEDGRIVRTIGWESNRYPPQRINADDDACWEATAVGAPLPEVCLTPRILFDETDPYDQAAWIAFAATLTAIAALLAFALRRIAWQPAVDSRTLHAPPPRSLDPSDAVSLMRSVTEEKLAQDQAAGERRDVRRPFLVGAAIAAAALLPPVFLIGYGARLLFFTGIAGTLLLASAIGLVQRTPLEALHGIAPARLSRTRRVVERFSRRLAGYAPSAADGAPQLPVPPALAGDERSASMARAGS